MQQMASFSGGGEDGGVGGGAPGQEALTQVWPPPGGGPAPPHRLDQGREVVSPIRSQLLKMLPRTLGEENVLLAESPVLGEGASFIERLLKDLSQELENLMTLLKRKFLFP